MNPPAPLSFYLQNHDQVANQLRGERLHALTSARRAIACFATILLLGPSTPMLFMGQEFGATTPFVFFADHGKDLAEQVHRGRKEFLSQFPSYGSPDAQAQVPDPGSRDAFERSILDSVERVARVFLYRFHQDLLRIRREDHVVAAQRRDRVDGAVLNESALVIRYFGDQDDDRLLLLNWGQDSTIGRLLSRCWLRFQVAFGDFTGRATIPITAVTVSSIRAVSMDGVFPARARRSLPPYRWSVNSVASGTPLRVGHSHRWVYTPRIADFYAKTFSPLSDDFDTRILRLSPRTTFRREGHLDFGFASCFWSSTTDFAGPWTWIQRCH